MKKYLLFSLLLITGKMIWAQNTVSFDALSFSEPPNWKFTDNGTYRTYLDVNHDANTFCIISVYASFASSGNTATDFQTAWQAEVAGHFHTTKTLSPKTAKAGSGISYLQDEGPVSNDQSNFQVRLIMFNVNGKCQPVLFLSLNEDGFRYYKSSIDNFLKSIEPANETSLLSFDKIKDSTLNSGSSITTSFDDGWISQVKDDYVLLTRNNSKVYLFYAEKFNDESRANTTEYFYTHQVLKEYTITNVHARSDYNKYVIEGDAIEKSTGKQCYAVMNVVAKNGIAKNVLEVAPTLNQLMQETGIDFEKMTTYNRFAVTLQNIEGKWKGGSGTSQTYYDFYSGSPVGASAVVMSNKFSFNSNGSYTAEFKGGYGMVGNLKTYQQEEKGKLAIIMPWQISTTDQDNKTVLYDCWLEAIKGGMLLHLINHQYTGETFDLVRDNTN